MIFTAVRLAGNAERAGRALRRRCAGYEKFSGARKRKTPLFRSEERRLHFFQRMRLLYS